MILLESFRKNSKKYLYRHPMGEYMKIHLNRVEALPEANAEELSKVILSRLGLIPRKKDGRAQFHTLLLALYEAKKEANRERRPEQAVLPVEVMAMHAGIKRQTMYDYLGRWLSLNILKKTSFVNDGKVVIGYELNGTNLEGAFKKAEQVIAQHAADTTELIRSLQNQVKKEKLSSNLTGKDQIGEISSNDEKNSEKESEDADIKVEELDPSSS